jgi:pheromone shutdown protein TraB
LLRGSNFVGEGWQHRNECMARKIAACAKRFPAKRVVVVVGAEHRPMLRDLLESESGLTCKEYWELE